MRDAIVIERDFLFSVGELVEAIAGSMESHMQKKTKHHSIQAAGQGNLEPPYCYRRGFVGHRYGQRLGICATSDLETNCLSP